MAEIIIKVDVPEALKDKFESALTKVTKEFVRTLENSISSEEKRTLVAKFIDESMKGAKQLSDNDLVEFGRHIKNGRFKQ
jgi:hypothetical protein